MDPITIDFLLENATIFIVFKPANLRFLNINRPAI